jgi:hypothetical protein
VPPAHLIPIPHGADLKPAGMPPQVFNRDRTQAEAFLRELRLYMMANYEVLGFESPIRQIAITLTFIKGPQVNRWVEGILQALEQLNLVEDNVKYTYINFLVRFFFFFFLNLKSINPMAIRLYTNTLHVVCMRLKYKVIAQTMLMSPLVMYENARL